MTPTNPTHRHWGGEQVNGDKWPEIEPPEELVLSPWAKHALENPPEPIDPDDIDPFTGSPYRCGTPTNPTHRHRGRVMDDECTWEILTADGCWNSCRAHNGNGKYHLFGVFNWFSNRELKRSLRGGFARNIPNPPTDTRDEA